MKIRKLYENEIKDNSVLSDYFKVKKNFIFEKEKVVKLLNEFKSFFDKAYWRLEYPTGIISDCYFSEREDKLVIQANDNYYPLKDEDFKKLINFLEDPELYRNQKKFNI